MPQLKTENPHNGLAAISAFFRLQHIPRTSRGSYDYVFEHGHLWTVCGRNGGQWSVMDAEGPGSYNGFSFECVTTPDTEP